jgi:hypothetical protein
MEAADYFRKQAAECRRLANDLGASFERNGLLQLARHYDAEARRAERDAAPNSAPGTRAGEMARI